MLILGDRRRDRQMDMTTVIDAFPDCTNAPINELLLTFVHMKLDGFHLQHESPTFLWQRVTTAVLAWFTDLTWRNDSSGIPSPLTQVRNFYSAGTIYKRGRGLHDRTWRAVDLRCIIYSIVSECGVSRCEIAGVLMTCSKVSNSRTSDKRLNVGKWEGYVQKTKLKQQ